MNTVKKEREQKSPENNYPWLDPDDDRRHMMDREILEKYINLNNSGLNKEEKMKIMDMLYKYKEAFSLRDEKSNLAYPLVKDTFSVLGNSKCKVLSVLDLKDAFNSLKLSENSKRYCGILPYFSSPSYLYQRMPMGLNISPSIW